MDPITAVGFAASILNFVDFSWTLIKGSYEVYELGIASDNMRITSVLSDLEGITKSLQSDVKGNSPHVKDLKSLAAECIEMSQELSVILKDLQMKEGNKIWRSLEAKWKSMRKEKEIAAIEQKLIEHRLQLLLRLNLILGEQQTSVKSQLDEIQDTGLQLSSDSLDKLTTVHQAIQNLERKLTGELFQSLKLSDSDNTVNTASLSEMHASLLSLIAQLKAVSNSHTAETRILKKLYFNSIHSRSEAISDAESGTFGWLLEDDSKEAGLPGSDKTVRYDDELELHQRTRHSFLKWLNSGSRIYHISGKAGSGKSTIMKSLTQHPQLMEELRKWAGDKKLVFGKFFFWNSGHVQQKSLEGLYRSLLFEILNQYPDLIKEIFPSHWNNSQTKMSRWEDMPFLFSELKAAMGVIVGRHKFPGHRFCFFIDGLDEFEAENMDHWELAQMLQEWASSDEVKICVSSRPYTEFLEIFDSNLRMQLHDLTCGDIQRFTHANFEKESYFIGSEKTLLEIVETIVKRADGVFLWVRLVVRSLLDGVRHRSSLPALKEKLDLIPRGLDSLFDRMFNDIDPADRGRSDRMLILAASHGSRNALFYSWLEDLKDPDFPYKAPIKAYSDQEIMDRHSTVRAQLDSLSKGLLEMKTSDWSQGTSIDTALAPSDDIYFRYNVDFFHRSVRDYLAEPVRYARMKKRLGDFDNTQAYQRLLLSEFKFARTTNKYLTQTWDANWLYQCFEDLCYGVAPSEEIPPRLLNEVGEVLEYHRQNPYSHPDEKIQNLGNILWGVSWDSRQHEMYDNSFSYLHWLAHAGQHNYVTTQLPLPKSVAPVQERSLLLSASIAPPRYNLVCDLLKHGVSPKDQITLTSKKIPQDEWITTVWAVFLTILAQQVRTLRFFDRGHERIRDYFLILEEYLKWGGDNDVCFVFEKDNEKSDKDGMLLVTLEDFILIEKPPNSDMLMNLVLKGKGSLLQNGALQLLSKLRPWIGGAVGAEPKYKKVLLDDRITRKKDNWVIKSVCIRGNWLENDFIVALY
ncbi:hypothetical protein L207DRAFT_448582 [Hyaloscypha variabilis F]|uniref:Uncharacterized protein n=1 Tax=Hyaloscypha variabilis (strain UAMH 11265 / GT02V1 / F) TaxID=1149755 RepID=A0A2J6S8I3_HYAVF|nr:hypothetical protein L207DRAFT_448582 [Hyaloscypha variabilis F]